MKDTYLYRVIRDSVYAGLWVYVLYWLADIIFIQTPGVQFAEVFLILFFVIMHVILIANINSKEEGSGNIACIGGHKFDLDSIEVIAMPTSKTKSSKLSPETRKKISDSLKKYNKSKKAPAKVATQRVKPNTSQRKK